MRKCKHESVLKVSQVEFAPGVKHEFFNLRNPLVPVRICQACLEWLPLGPSNNDDPNVAVEIRAAEIAGVLRHRGVIEDYDEREADGFAAAERNSDYAADPDDHWWHAGYLARCIATHRDPIEMTRLVCCQCRQPRETFALYAKGGYADGPRPCCEDCFDGDRYLQNRFTPRAFPTPLPTWAHQWRIATHEIAVGQGEAE